MWNAREGDVHWNINIGCWLWDVDTDCCWWDSDILNCCWGGAGSAWCRKWASVGILTYLCCLWTAWSNEVGSSCFVTPSFTVATEIIFLWMGVLYTVQIHTTRCPCYSLQQSAMKSSFPMSFQGSTIFEMTPIGALNIFNGWYVATYWPQPNLWSWILFSNSDFYASTY